MFTRTARLRAQHEDAGWEVTDVEPDVRLPAILTRENGATAALATARGLGVATRSSAGAVATTFRGLGLVVRDLNRWMLDAEGRDVRSAKAKSLDAKDHREAAELHERTWKFRTKFVAVVSVVALIAVAVLWAVSPYWWRVAFAASVPVSLWLKGRSPVVEGDVLARADESGPLTDRHAAEALARSVPKVDVEAVKVIHPTRAVTNGWTVDLALPPGVGASEAVKVHEKIASALGIPGDVLVVAPGSRSAGAVSLTVLSAPLRDLQAVRSPYSDAQRVNAWDGVQIGTTALGEPAILPVVHANGMLGAQSQSGKSSAARHFAVALSLDPRVELHLHGWKGGPDFRPLQPVAHYYRMGESPEDFAAAAADLRGIVDRMNARWATIENLPADRLPEDGRANSDLADDPALDLHPLIIIWDEAQVAFTHRKHGDELAEMFEDISRRGPGVGIEGWVLTQSFEGESIPTRITKNAVNRWCLSVDTWQASDQVLGTGMNASGVSALQFTTADKGIGWVKGTNHGKPVVVRSHYLTQSEANRIVAEAYRMRVAEGRLTGMAAGDIEPDNDLGEPDFLGALRAAWPTTVHGKPAAGMWVVDIATALGLDVEETRYRIEESGLSVEPVSLYQPATATTKAGTRKRHGITWAQLAPADDDRQDVA